MTPPASLGMLAFSATLARWCRLRGYPGSAAAHGFTAFEAAISAIAGKPWLPPLLAID